MAWQSRLKRLPILVLCTAFPTHAAIIPSGDVFPGDIADGDTSFAQVGGDFTTTGTGTLEITQGSVLTTRSDAAFANIAPLANSQGTASVTGTDGSGNSSTWQILGPDNHGNDGAFLTVGRAGVGVLSIDDGGKVLIDSLGAPLGRVGTGEGFPAGFQLGGDETGSGTANITGADSELRVTSDYAVGFIGNRGQGEMHITDGGTLRFEGINSDLNVVSDAFGRDQAQGTLNVNSGGTVEGPVFFDVGGSQGGTGVVNLDGADSSINLRGACTSDCPAGFSFPDQGAFMTIGAREGTGEVNVTGGASIIIDSTDVEDAQNPGFSLGANPILGPRGDGTLNVEGGGSSVLAKGDDAFFAVGRLEDGAGLLTISDGGSVVLQDAHGQSGGFGFIGDRAGATGTVIVDGPSSILDSGDFLGLGVTQNLEDEGRGTLLLTNGGTVRADRLEVGGGGIVAGNGTLEADTRVNRGYISPGLSTGELTFDGDLTLDEGTILVEAQSEGDFDRINVTGDLFLNGGAVDLLLGFVPDIVLDGIFNVAGEIIFGDDFRGVNAFALDGFEDFVSSGTQVSMRIGNEQFNATVARVPEPGTLLLLLAGLIGLMMFRPIGSNGS